MNHFLRSGVEEIRDTFVFATVTAEGLEKTRQNGVVAVDLNDTLVGSFLDDGADVKEGAERVGDKLREMGFIVSEGEA